MKSAISNLTLKKAIEIVQNDDILSKMRVRISVQCEDEDIDTVHHFADVFGIQTYSYSYTMLHVSALANIEDDNDSSISCSTYKSLDASQYADSVKDDMRVSKKDNLSKEQKFLLDMLETALKYGIDKDAAAKFIEDISSKYDFVSKA
jgi:hypothetical protein